ncbi:MAG: family 78 glycoside hydrolase catalytic domain [Eubacteriales bacterium]|nr:family 78 glycoside hydrolase catalytic domain [Eubacteriales bacterium]
MRIINVRMNGIENPVGFAYEKLSCSWNVCGAESKKQKYARIEVSESADFSKPVYVKEGENLCQSGESLEIDLKPRTVYYYRVTVIGDKGEEAKSETAFFETGKMQEQWQAQWIAPVKEDDFHPVLRKSFSVKNGVKRARLYVCGVGLFEAWMNGKKLGEEYLTPYLNHYETNMQVITLKAEALLSDNKNTLEIFLGKGWYMGVFGLDLQPNHFGDRMAAIAELHVEYEDGTEDIVATDDTWKYCGSDVEESGIYFGEILNRCLWKDRKNPLKPVEVLENPQFCEGTRNLDKSHLTDRISLPVLAMEELEVQEVIHTPKGETVLDMGQNFAGFVEFEAELLPGTRVVLDFGEILQEGNFYNGNYRDAQSQFVYVSDGRKETVRPHFTFFGFRYVRVQGWPGELRKDDFRGRALYSDISRTGYIHTCDKRVNRLYENTVWGLKSNFIDMPTDCPQRSERLGWTGDAQVFAPTASYHMDTRAFFHKFIKDLRDEQKMIDGAVPNFLPNFGHPRDAGSVWGDIATLLPNTLYTYYGDLAEMEFCYPLMKDWVDYIDREDAARGERQYLYNFGDTFGDWLALDGPTPTSFKGSTDDFYVSSMYYYNSIQIVQKMAERLGKAEDAAHYMELGAKVKQAILNEYFTPNGRLSIDTQAAYVIALKFGIYLDKERIIRQFRTRLQRDMYQIKCGFVGAPLLCTVLAEAGEYELAYDFLLKEGFPGWLYSVDLGATTIWERWNSVMPDGSISGTGMNSLNHYAYGSVMEFVYAYAAGIRPLEPGFKKAVIAPNPDIRLRKIDCTYQSVNGAYVSNWEICKDGRIKAHVEIPFNCEAQVSLPGYVHKTMTLTAGSYDFDYIPERDFRRPYTKNTTLARISKDRAAMEILGKYTPVLAGIAASKDPEMGANSLEDMLGKGFLPFDPAELRKAIAEIENLTVL